MRITSLTIENFRNIESIEIDMQAAPITVLVGKNAVGKSTVLNAM